MVVSPFVRCVCNKIHVVSPSAFRKQTCPDCGQDLWDLITGQAYK